MFVLAPDAKGRLRKVHLPLFVVHVLLAVALVGSITILAAFTSYSRILWKATRYNALRKEKETLKLQYNQLQAMVTDTNQKLSSLQSLATEVAMTYGVLRFRQTPFRTIEDVDVTADADSRARFDASLEQLNFLRSYAPAIALRAQGVPMLPGQSWDDLLAAPSLWPVHGRLTGSFGERLDPLNGEGTFHSGVDISTSYGERVEAAADGVVVAAEYRSGYGRVVVIEHLSGISTWYAHLSGFRVYPGMRVRRGDVIGYVGASGKATGPHLHYEVRIHDTPVNPWTYLRS